jgi:ketosteroid isomerase-like protein
MGRAEDPPPTEILNPSVLPTAYAQRSPLTTPQQQARPTEPSAHDFASPPPPRPERNTLVIPITIAATVLVLMLGGIGAWLLFSDRNRDRPGNVRVGGERTTRTPAPGPSATPVPATPTPAPSPVDAAAVRREVTEALNGWTEASMARDIEAHMNYYADTLEFYYTRTQVSSSVVRADRQRAYDTFSSLDMELSNIKITPDASGERATVIFDKTWNFEGEEKVSSGSVQQEVRLAKTDGRWRIIGEKDLRVYYVNK